MCPLPWPGPSSPSLTRGSLCTPQPGLCPLSAGVFSLSSARALPLDLSPQPGFSFCVSLCAYLGLPPQPGFCVSPQPGLSFPSRGFCPLPEVLPLPSAGALCHSRGSRSPHGVPLPSLRFPSPSAAVFRLPSAVSLSPGRKGALPPSPHPLWRVPASATRRAPGTHARPRPFPPVRGRLSRERRDFSPTCRAVLLMAALERGR